MGSEVDAEKKVVRLGVKQSEPRDKLMKVKGTLMKLAGDIESVNLQLLGENIITLKFADADTANYVRNICRRKGVTLENYILGNFEWDDQPECVFEEITAEVCDGCQYNDGCPDAIPPGGEEK